MAPNAMATKSLHDRGILPGLDIVGVDDQHHLLTRDQSTGMTSAQDASQVHDASPPVGSTAERELGATMLANQFGIGITKNPDGSYDVQNPLDDPRAVGGILNRIFNGMGGGADSSAQPGSEGQIGSPIGMNSWMSQAWSGWSDPSSSDDTQQS